MTREQFIQLVSDEQEALRGFLLALCCGNKDDADDIAQDALVKAYLPRQAIRIKESSNRGSSRLHRTHSLIIRQPNGHLKASKRQKQS